MPGDQGGECPETRLPNGRETRTAKGLGAEGQETRLPNGRETRVAFKQKQR